MNAGRASCSTRLGLPLLRGAVRLGPGAPPFRLWWDRVDGPARPLCPFLPIADVLGCALFALVSCLRSQGRR